MAEKVAWILGTSLLTLLGIFLVGLPQVLSQRRARRLAKQMTDYNDGLSSVHEGLARLLQSDRRRSARNEFFRAMLQGAVGLFGLRGARVCVYLLDGREDDAQEASDADFYLKLQDYAGRNDVPRSSFHPDTDYGAAIIEAAIQQRQVTVSNRYATSVPLNYHTGTVWKSFFVIPLAGKDHVARGVLTVDTRESTVFTEEDITVGYLVARLIGVGVEEIYDAANEARPDAAMTIAQLFNSGISKDRGMEGK
ncbi:GAF domain-containing protein [Curtobacterium sp. NPDC092190]|uniref:GAF domain-containing protein n=1 Tax=Curtobacterium sp. NPDC092190 TaxID=3363973 RepID=UPI0038144C6F